MRPLLHAALFLIMTTNPQKPIIKTPLSDPNSTQSRQLNSLVTERNSLQKHIGELQAKQDFWHDWYFDLSIAAVGFTVLAAFCGALAVAASKLESKRSYDVRPVSAELTVVEGKIEQANHDDSQIAILEASTLASVAEGHTEGLRKANVKLSADLAKEIADAQTRAEKLREQNLAVEKDLESEKGKRVKLAASLLPRDFFDQSGALAALKSIQPMPVVFTYVNENEPRHMAEQIAWVFWQLGWPFSRTLATEEFIRPGITVGTGFAPGLRGTVSSNRSLSEQHALVRKVVGVITNSGIEAEAGFPEGGFTESDGTLVISVGTKPNQEMEEALQSLGPRKATPLSKSGGTAGSNSIVIPLKTGIHKPAP